MRKGKIFVISAPSGSGKTTIARELLKRSKGLERSVSMTTRPPRPGEENKKDYYYITEEEFKDEIKKGNLLEWEENFGHLYGTPKRFILEKIEAGKDVLLAIDVKGAMNVKKKFPESILIFVKPPSLKELSHRLSVRNTNGDSEIRDRLKIAKQELAYASKYDYTVVNDKLGKAVGEIVKIIEKRGK